ncbi:hypothetical protein GBAR_LOCUS13317 [Geodia barretti]|uniref:Uncharacterized protein n=1 Tax=Geodia barretti TaxID=519541 RepID=A0AA35S4X1_GEOBA|nr:hypothetical protein GBAR_LOCUS13317 [Geodia barretti]
MFIIVNLALCPHTPVLSLAICQYSFKCNSKPVSLMECPSDEMGPIPHWEVGKYFTRFTGKNYIPNAPLKEVYPDDP